MFPIPFNFPFRKSDGTLSTIGAEMGGGGGSAVDTTARERANAAYALAETADTKATNAATAASAADGKAVTAQNTVDNAFKTMGAVGAKNLLSYPYEDNTKTTNGVTFTVNDDGTIDITGTATADAYFVIKLRNNASGLSLKKGSYILNGVNDGSTSTFNLYILNQDNSQTIARDVGGGASFTLDSDVTMYGVNIRVVNGTEMDTTIKPMIRVATDPDDTYAPYAKTNKELTDDMANLPSGGGGLYSKTFTTELTSSNVTKRRTISDSNHVDTCVWEVKNIINQSGYIPIGVIVGDNYTGYYSVGSIQKTGDNYTVEILSTYSGSSYDEFAPLTVIYAPTSGVTPIT